MNYTYYKVGGHVFALCTEDCRCVSDDDMKQYEPFLTEPTENVVFRISVSKGSYDMTGFQKEWQQEDGEQTIIVGTLDGKPCFQFFLSRVRSSVLVVNKEYDDCVVYVEKYRMFGINNALMVLYALSTADMRTALFHSSVVSHDRKAYMFLGKSGTGKSTHSGLWLKYIDGTELVNDDNPVVRVEDRGVMVYGSPWSGKTPCYRNVCFPVGAIVQLSQAPHNAIRRLKGVTAYAALVPSISGKRWDKRQADGLHETENLLTQSAAVYHLECLPDEEAARVCYGEVTK